MAPRDARRRKSRRMARDNTDCRDDSNLDVSDEEMNERRANTSSEDEDEADLDAAHPHTSTALAQFDPAVNSLVQDATQYLGSSHADSTAFAMAAVQQCPENAIRLLAAATAKTSIDTARTSNHAAHAVVTAELASEGLRNSDVTYDNRYERQNTINEQNETARKHHESLLEDHDRAVMALHSRVVRLESLLGRALSTLLSNQKQEKEASRMAIVTSLLHVQD